MSSQDNVQDHVWELTYTDHRFQNRIIKYEQCTKCNAARVIEFPSGEILGFEPEGSSTRTPNFGIKYPEVSALLSCVRVRRVI